MEALYILVIILCTDAVGCLATGIIYESLDDCLDGRIVELVDMNNKILSEMPGVPHKTAVECIELTKDRKV